MLVGLFVVDFIEMLVVKYLVVVIEALDWKLDVNLIMKIASVSAKISNMKLIQNLMTTG